MAAIERTAYPQFRHEPNARELQDLFTPALAKIDFEPITRRQQPALLRSGSAAQMSSIPGLFP